eukprot:CAMPEP_0172304788 /NCGR_PEP_ID=MMETSP1058-20130122/6172_1 /TAXON_ID=83371 /ORGANISM="Detonula confervacea, Strain CCMP 353" /LENGTH=65 /DNA_ID=CAMNT_0013016163 /DNA_START=1 /DNA_END=198 /DNA_ORIENTATION=-
MIAATTGHDLSMRAIKEVFELGCVTKDDYEKTLRAYNDYVEEMKSEDRDKATAALQSSKWSDCLH